MPQLEVHSALDAEILISPLLGVMMTCGSAQIRGGLGYKTLQVRYGTCVLVGTVDESRSSSRLKPKGTSPSNIVSQSGTISHTLTTGYRKYPLWPEVGITIHFADHLCTGFKSSWILETNKKMAGLTTQLIRRGCLY